MTGLNSAQLSEASYLSGLKPNGTLTGTFWSWDNHSIGENFF
jgi:hypothetical protein